MERQMSPQVVALISFVPVLLVSVFLHELGHVVFARLAGAVPTSFGIQTGRVVFVCPLWGTRFFLGTRGFPGGVTFCLFPQLLPGRGCKVLTFAGGMIANALVGGLAVAVLTLSSQQPLSPLWIVVAGVNAFLVAGSAVPHSGRIGPLVLLSDGALILHALLGRTARAPASALRTIDSLAALLRQVGDLRSLRAFLVQAADIWCDLGDPGHGRELLDAARALSVEPLAPYRTHELLVLASIESSEGNWERGEGLCHQAIDEFGLQHHEIGLFLAEMVLCGIATRRGDAEQLSAAYGRLARSPVVFELIKADASLSSRLLAFKEGQGTQVVLAEYEAVPANMRTHLTDLQAYRSAARSLRRSGLHEQAAAAYFSALSAVTALDATFQGTDRERFRLAQAPLLEEARASFSQVGLEDAACRVVRLFVTSDELEKKKAAEQKLANQRWYGRLLRYGLALTLFNLVAVIATPILFKMAVDAKKTGLTPSTRVAAVQPTAPLSIWIAIAVATVFEGIFCTPLLLIGLWRPDVRRVNAVLVASLSSLSWLVGIGFYLCDALIGR
jgi:hypothetical protein